MTKIKGYIGTYTKRTSKGIYSFEYIKNSSFPSKIKLEYEIENPTYLDIQKDILACTTSKKDLGGLSLFKITDSNLIFKDELFYPRRGPCFINISKNKIYSANYHMNRVDISSFNNYKFQTNTTIFNNKLTTHFHCILKSPFSEYIFIIDLGNTEILIYNTKTLKHLKTINLPKISGPRHIVFNTSLEIFYLITETSGELFTYSYKNLHIKLLNKLNLINSSFENLEGSAIKISKDNHYIYTSERKTNTITLFTLDNNGIPKKTKEFNSLKINNPRDFNISNCGNYIFIASYLNDEVKIFRLDTNTGFILNEISSFYVPEPVCIKFI